MSWSGEWDEDFYFVHIGSSVLTLRDHSRMGIWHKRGWSGATDFGWSPWALAVVE